MRHGGKRRATWTKNVQAVSKAMKRGKNFEAVVDYERRLREGDVISEEELRFLRNYNPSRSNYNPRGSSQ